MPIIDCCRNSSWPLQPSSNQTEKYQGLARAIIIRLRLFFKKGKKFLKRTFVYLINSLTSILILSSSSHSHFPLISPSFPACFA